jgi:hypothetical protein
MFPIGNMKSIMAAIKHFKKSQQDRSSSSESVGFKQELGSNNEVSEGPFKRPVPFVDKKPSLDNSGIIQKIVGMTKRGRPENIPGGGGYNAQEDLSNPNIT